jgi:hypothetical protein
MARSNPASRPAVLVVEDEPLTRLSHPHQRRLREAVACKDANSAVPRNGDAGGRGYTRGGQLWQPFGRDQD